MNTALTFIIVFYFHIVSVFSTLYGCFYINLLFTGVAHPIISSKFGIFFKGKFVGRKTYKQNLVFAAPHPEGTLHNFNNDTKGATGFLLDF